MGYTTTMIPFFSDEIELDVHSASYPEYLGHTSIRSFAEAVGGPVSLERRDDNGEYIVSSGKYPDIVFMSGPEI